MKKIFNLQRKNIKGVSLIELMISLSILSIIAAIASPNFSTWLGTIAVKNTGETITSGINLARSEAVKLNQPVEFIIDENGGWTVRNAETAAVIYQKSANDSAKVSVFIFPVAQTIATFNGLGQLKAVNADTSLPFEKIELSSTFNNPNIYGAEVRLSTGGSVRLCSLNENSNNYCGD